jgi:catechol 2,3-dioxygenase-like lactoylglutathione lyase family enzyme
MNGLLSRRWIAAVCLLSICLARHAVAQTLGTDHIEVFVNEPDQSLEWYTAHVGGTRTTKDRVGYGGMQLIIHKIGAPKQDGARTLIDHIGIPADNAEAKAKELIAAGATRLDRKGDLPVKSIFLKDPWGVIIEVVEDREPLGFHHIHLRSANPSATLTQHQGLWKAERTKFKGKVDALHFNPVWLFVAQEQPTDAPINPALDHFALRITSFDTMFAELKGKGLKQAGQIMSPPGIKSVYVSGPENQRIEIIQRDKK